MQKIEVCNGNLQWPSKCCGCGSDQFSPRKYVETIVIGMVSTVAVTRRITMDGVPICDKCMQTPTKWINAAILIGIGLIGVIGFRDGRVPIGLTMALLGIATVLANLGFRSKALQILKIDEKKNTLLISVRNVDVAKKLVELESKRPISPEYQQYLAAQAVKRRRQKWVFRWSVRVIYTSGVGIGLWLIIGLGAVEGYDMIGLGVVIGLLFEALRRFRRKK